MLHEKNKVADQRVRGIFHYLLNKGWTEKVNFPNNQVWVLEGPYKNIQGESIKIVLPKNQDYEYIDKTINSILNTLSTLEKREKDQILAEIEDVRADHLQIRILSEKVEDGQIPVTDAVKLFGGIEKLIIAAVSAENEPQPYYRRASKRASEYVQNCRLNTRTGSFIINVELDSQIPEETHVPISEGILRRIMTGMNKLKIATRNNDVESVISSYHHGLTKNMCDALLEIQQVTEDNIEYKFLYSEKSKLGNKNIPNVITLDKEDFVTLKKASESFREKYINVEEKEIIGNIIKLTSDDTAGSGEKHIVTVRYENKNINLELSAEDYRKACDAHRDAKLINAKGVLKKERKKYMLIDVKEFDVVDDHFPFTNRT